MVLPRPLILAIAGVALLLTSFLVVQRQRTVADTPEASESVPATPTAATPDKTPPAERRKPPVGGSRNANPSPDPQLKLRDRKPKSTPTRPAETGVALERGVPAGVARALAQRKVIALLFTLEGAADDSATRSALRSLKTGSKSKVAVFTDSIANVGRYSRLVGSLGISQVPSVVIVDTNRQAQLLEGYVDSGTLRQYVADAKR